MDIPLSAVSAECWRDEAQTFYCYILHIHCCIPLLFEYLIQLQVDLLLPEIATHGAYFTYSIFLNRKWELNVLLYIYCLYLLKITRIHFHAYISMCKLVFIALYHLVFVDITIAHIIANDLQKYRSLRKKLIDQNRHRDFVFKDRSRSIDFLISQTCQHYLGDLY